MVAESIHHPSYKTTEPLEDGCHIHTPSHFYKMKGTLLRYRKHICIRGGLCSLACGKNCRTVGSPTLVGAGPKRSSTLIISICISSQNRVWRSSCLFLCLSASVYKQMRKDRETNRKSARFVFIRRPLHPMSLASVRSSVSLRPSVVG